jgi:integrase
MSTYSTKNTGWRYDFIHKGIRHTVSGFKTKTLARKAEAKRREELEQPKQETKIQADMDFTDLVNKRLAFVKAYMSKRHYLDQMYQSKKWVKEWDKLKCSQITEDMIYAYLLKRSGVSHATANKDLISLRALFNLAIKRKWLTHNPTVGIERFPVDKSVKYVPSLEDVLKVILVADFEMQDYLFVIKESMCRMSEVNNLTWDDVDLNSRNVVLYTRKKKGGHRTPRTVPMSEKLFEVLSRRYNTRDKDKPWVFWHRYMSRIKKTWVVGPYKERSRIMKTLCEEAGVKYFRYHALRHLGATVLDRASVNIGSIQRLLGHENRTTTEIYLHSINESEREAIKVFDELAKKSHTNPHTSAKQKNR